MKTLYLSDLDGTLLRSDQQISEYSKNIINQFIQNGNFFSYATARSNVTASKVTAGLNLNIPVICYNGAFIIENETKEILSSNYFSDEEVSFIFDNLTSNNVYPVVFAEINGKEQFSYINKYINPVVKHFLDSRIGDPRRREVSDIEDLYCGKVFYVACMDSEKALIPIEKCFNNNNKYNCIYHKDIYSNGQWCEILPVSATKANAAKQLMSILGCQRLVAFGDGLNDIPLFTIADEKYAVSNAASELKDIATAIIESNDNDGVARWLIENRQ